MTIHHTDPSAADGVKALTATLTKGDPCRKYNDIIHISGHDANYVDISFQRTVRVPDNQGENDLPPSMGTFPLYPVANYRETLPTEMTSKGGLFFPMYQREAMWINFRARKPFAIKVFLGGVNAVSGDSMNDSAATMMRRLTKMNMNESIQDYVVTPPQLWLDGIASDAGSVRQFVGMPLGSGYSVEAQVTGQEITGGMQFLVVPSKRRPTLLGGPRRPGTMSIIIQTLTGGIFEVDNLTPETRIEHIKDFLEVAEGTPAEDQRLIFAGKQLEDGRTAEDYRIAEGATLHLVYRLRGGGCDPKVFELGVAAGGLIKQCIVEDKYPESMWDHERALQFNVQILNSECFEQVTGQAPPATPISADTYASHGLPFFDIYNESSKVKGDFVAVKSLVAMDKEKVGENGNNDDLADELPIATPVVLLNPDGTTSCLRFKAVNVLKAELQAMNHAQF